MGFYKQAPDPQEPPAAYVNYAETGQEPPLTAEEMIKWDEYQRKLRRDRFMKFPYPVLLVLVYLFLGFALHWWHPTWMLFLTVPLYYGMAAGI